MNEPLPAQVRNATTKPRKQLTKPLRFLYKLVELAGSFGLLFSVLGFTTRFDIEPLAKVCIPILAVFFGFAALLYNRARALEPGPAQTRSLYGAERAMQATIFALIAIIIGAVLCGIFSFYGFYPNAPIGLKNLFLLVFLFPILLLQMGYLCFLISLRSISHDYLRKVSVRELHRRIAKARTKS
jgi:hypothetical protein